MTDDLIDALARGLHALDCHQWGPSDFEALEFQYRRDAERFLLPFLGGGTEPTEPTDEEAAVAAESRTA